MVGELYAGATDPVWFGDRKVYSVTGFVLGVRSRIVDLPSFWVQGEISDFKHQRHLSMVYFTLKDPENGYNMRCTMRRSRFESLDIQLTDGDKVHVFGRADLYAPQGSFQLRAQSIEHTGRGLLMQQLEELKVKLAAEGLFDDSRKRALPFLPRRVGLITGSDAAAQGDFLRQIVERFPPVKIAMVETLVQGDRAAPQLIAALRKLQQVDDVDVIVITRGGGAFEHFLPFSDERLCRAIAACPKPVVSAIGHEKDSPLSDFVADLRVSTPTAAARTVVPDYRQLVDHLDRARTSIRRRGTDRFERRVTSLAAQRARLTNRSPEKVVRDRQRFVSQLRMRATTLMGQRLTRSAAALVRDRRDLNRCAAARIGKAQSRQQIAIEKLRTLSPVSTLARGYSIVRREHDRQLVRSSHDVRLGERVTMTLARGELAATVAAGAGAQSGEPGSPIPEAVHEHD